MLPQHTAFDTAHPAVPAAFLVLTLGMTMASTQPVLIGLSFVGAFAYSTCARGFRASIASLRWQIPLVAVIAVLNLAKRVYEIVFAYFTMPIAMSTLPLDDGARFKNWRELFVSKLILAYGAVFAVNIFALILPLINAVHLDGVNDFGNAIFTIFMIVGGAMLIPAGQTLFARLFGQGDDMRAGGGWMRSAFYGGRIAGAMTVGLAAKGIRAVASRRKGDGGGAGAASGSGDSSDKYTEDGAGEIAAAETQGGESS